jgi:hypothetical protein
MDLTSFDLLLNENKMSDMHRRLKELRALNKPADDIIKEFAAEFYADKDGALEKATKFLVGKKPFLKNYVSMSDSQLENLPKKEMEKLRNRYSEHMSMKEFNKFMREKNPHRKIVETITRRVIESG